MNLYPALQADMGSWKYYIVKMRMREVASEVLFATEVYEDRTLDDAHAAGPKHTPGLAEK